MDIGDNIKRLREARGLTQDELGAALGVGGTSVSNWEKKRATPLMGRVMTMALLFGVPIESITGEPIGVREDRALYGTCPTAPLYGKIAAGIPIEKLPVEDELFVPPHIIGDHPRAFFLEVKGESMNRLFPNGCYVLVDPDLIESDGDVMAVTVNGYAATIKRVFRGQESLTLAPESFDSRFEDERVTDPESVRPIGRVVWWMAPYGKRL